MRMVLAFALAACVAQVDAFAGTSPTLRVAGRPLSGLCMTADDQLLSRRNILSSAVVAAV